MVYIFISLFLITGSCFGMEASKMSLSLDERDKILKKILEDIEQIEKLDVISNFSFEYGTVSEQCKEDALENAKNNGIYFFIKKTIKTEPMGTPNMSRSRSEEDQDGSGKMKRTRSNYRDQETEKNPKNTLTSLRNKEKQQKEKQQTPTITKTKNEAKKNGQFIGIGSKSSSSDSGNRFSPTYPRKQYTQQLGFVKESSSRESSF